MIVRLPAAILSLRIVQVLTEPEVETEAVVEAPHLAGDNTPLLVTV